MEVLKNLLDRFRHSAVALILGFFVIIYIALGFIYWQQKNEQNELNEQSASINIVLANPLSSREELLAEYADVNTILSLADFEVSDGENITTDAKAIAILVSIAEQSGIDTSPANNKLRIPSAQVSRLQVGSGYYQVYSFRNINVEGSYDDVMAFISDLDTGETRGHMVLNRVTINQTEVRDEEGELIDTVTNATLDVDLYTK